MSILTLSLRLASELHTMPKHYLEDVQTEFAQLDFSQTPILFCIRQARTMLKRLLAAKVTQVRDNGVTIGKLQGIELVEQQTGGHTFQAEELGARVEALAAPMLGSDVKIKVEVRDERGSVLLNDEN